MYPSSEDWALAGELKDTVLLNDFHSDHAEGSNEQARCSFHLFPQLPAELRLSIWSHVLRRHRLIRLAVTDMTYQPPDEAILEHGVRNNNLGNMISGKNYKFQITTHHLLTPLLRVGCESRQGAMQFYRVHIPYESSSGERQFYFNPEFDFIHIHTKGPSKVLADLIHDFKAYDPKGVGILNLGIGVGKPDELGLPLGTPWIIQSSKLAYDTDMAACRSFRPTASRAIRLQNNTHPSPPCLLPQRRTLGRTNDVRLPRYGRSPIQPLLSYHRRDSSVRPRS
jgi:hypothetical protein